MSLGFARDSILNLEELAKNAEKLECETQEVSDDDNFLFIDDEDTTPEYSNNVSFNAGVKYTQEVQTPNISDKNHPHVSLRNQVPDLKGSVSSSINPPHSTYSGFSYDNDAYTDYYNEETMAYGFYDPYGASYGQSPKPGLLKIGQNKNIFCCLLTPWLRNDGECSDNDEDEKSFGYENQVTNIADNSHGHCPDDATESHVRKADQDDRFVKSHVDAQSHNSVVQRKILPTMTQQHDNNKVGGDCLPKSISGMRLAEKQEKKKQPTPSRKGILKNTGLQKHVPHSQTKTSRRNLGQKASNNQRRLLFPVYEQNTMSQIDENSNHSKSLKNVTFANMARVMTIEARSEISFMGKSMIWWQRSDYEEFKKTGRIIAKAMLQGGSEIWLQTSDAFGKKQREEKKAHRSHSEEYREALRRFGGSEEIDEEPDDDLENKWWCKFGHSRRGLEHIVTAEEGRQRQHNVNLSIKAVMDEQKMQRINNTRDSKKLSKVYMSYTHWARDLSFAAGTADAHAVSSNFAASEKNRSYFLRNAMTTRNKEILRNSLNEPSLAAILDANTRTNILLKHQPFVAKSSTKSPIKNERKSNKTNTSTFNKTIDEDINVAASNIPGLEPIHDHLPSSVDISKKAAGFSADSKCEINMGAVLSGLGSVNTNRGTTIGAH